MSTHSIYVISNACGQTYPENTLSSFTNTVPSTFPQAVGTQWECSLASLSLHANFDYEYLPPSTSMAPALMVVHTDLVHSGLDLSIGSNYPKACRIHLPHKPYNARILHEQIEQECKRISEDMGGEYAELGTTTFLTSISRGSKPRFQLGTKGADRKFKEASFIVFVHINLANRLMMKGVHGNPAGRKVHVNGKEYMCYYLGTGLLFESEPWVEQSRQMIPNSIGVECSEVSPTLSSQGFTRHLRVFTMDGTDNDGAYYEHNFKRLEWMKMDTNTIQELSIRLSDYFTGNTLLLRAGTSVTIAKLLLRQRPMENYVGYPDGFAGTTLRITSSSTARGGDATNIASNFKVRLPAPLNLPLSGQARCALSSCTLPNAFTYCPLPVKKRTLVCWRTHEMAVPGSVVDPDTNYIFVPTHKIEFNSAINNNADVISQFNAAIGLVSRGFEMVETYDGRLKFKFLEEHDRVSIHPEFAHFLGFGNTNEGFIAEEHEDEYIVLNHGTGTTNMHYTFPNAPRYHLYVPKNIFVYGDFVESSIVGGSHVNLLKILHVNKKAGTYVSHEFEHLDYFPLTLNNALTNMSIVMRDHTGAPVRFTNQNEIVIMSFLFA